jgi:hypothetical protein
MTATQIPVSDIHSPTCNTTGNHILQVRSVNFGTFCAAGGEGRFFTKPRSINGASDDTDRVARRYMLWVHVVSSVKISPFTGPRCPEGSRKLRFPDYVTMAQDGGGVVSLTHRPLFTPQDIIWYSFLLEAESTPGP